MTHELKIPDAIQPCSGACLCLPRPEDWRWWQAGTTEPLVQPADVWQPNRGGTP